MKDIMFFIEESNKISLGLNYDKTIKSIDSIEAYAHGMSENLMWKKEKN